MAKPQSKLAIELAKKAGIKIPGRDKIDQLIKQHSIGNYNDQNWKCKRKTNSR